MIGKGQRQNLVYLVDFGVSKRFEDKSSKHIKCTANKGLTGTPRYMSLNAHRCIELSRRDDLESVGYILLYFLRGNLPWQGLRSKDKDQSRVIILKIICFNVPYYVISYESYYMT